MKKAIFPGTFDPFTLGHLDILNRSTLIFDEIIIGIGINGDKRTMFNIDQRIDMIESIIKDNPKDWHANGTIKVCCEDGKVEIKVFEHDTINVHTLEITSEDGKCKARLSEQLTPPQE